MRKVEARLYQNQNRPLPIMHNLIRLAQYSLAHHSTRRRRVSRPTGPPSSLDSRVEIELTEETGDGREEGRGEGAPFCKLAAPLIPFPPSSFNLRAGLVKLALFPVPNL